MPMLKEPKPRTDSTQQLRKLLEEVLFYIQSDLLQRNAERLLPAYSRSNLFVKPKNWETLFKHGNNGHGLGQNGGNRSGHSRHPDLSDILDTVIGQAQHALLKKQNVKEGYW
ncbi:MAG: hypothetical protein HY610_00820, partial [Elusimicrobia bacterium]|nr:hypothetical protein [Elusimicrobiota bacterium]